VELPDLTSEYALEPATVEAYRRDGHVTVRGLATRGEVEAFRPAIAAVVDSVQRRADPQGRLDDYSRLFTQVTNAWRLSEPVRRFVCARRFAQVAARLMGVRGVRLYHDQALVKEPGGEPTPWHQDQYYWPLETDHTVTLWMPLVDVAPEMGPMTFASGSHRARDLEARPISEDTNARLARYVEEKRFALATGPLSAGDATFHSGRTLHSAGANRSPRRREVMTVIYFADGTRLSALDNPHRKVDAEVFLPGVRPGQLAQTPLNPLLYEERSG
jgi:ectoine hydroxylase-related dioxygenase (phytanoyl-CoA dioxygenase family)